MQEFKGEEYNGVRVSAFHAEDPSFSSWHLQVLGRNPLEMVLLPVSAVSNGLKDKWYGAMCSNLCDSVLFHYFE